MRKNKSAKGLSKAFLQRAISRRRPSFWLATGGVCGIAMFTGGKANAGLTFNNTFDISVQNYATANGVNVADIQSAFVYAENIFAAIYTNNASINLTLKFTTTGLAAADTANGLDLPYATARNLLLAHANSAAALAGLEHNLPATPPAGVTQIYLSGAQLKALGYKGSDSNTDSTV